jgi:calcineurin-like phosphoesterase family protein
MEEMHAGVIKKWNGTVKSKDTVFVIGDVTFGGFEETQEILSKLNGKKVLIRGNHDERFSSAEWLRMGFDDVRDICVIKKDQEKWILCHFPFSSPLKYFYRRWRGSRANYFKIFPSYKGHRLIHGHHHTGAVYHFQRLNVAWDIHQRLLNENELQSLFKLNQEIRVVRLLKTVLAWFW